MAWPSLAARTKDWVTEILTDSDLEGQFDLIITYINDMMNSTSGHKHDATTAEGPKILISNLTIASRAQGDVYYDNGTNPTRLAAGTSGYFLKTQGAGANPVWADATHTPTAANALDGSMIQVVSNQSGAVASGTTVMPFDDTIPQSSEGIEFLTQAITPNATTNNLLIQAVLVLAHSSGGEMGVALFQDATAGALAATSHRLQGADNTTVIVLNHFMAAGTTSATTFKIRAGCAGAGTTTLNGVSASRRYGGVYASSLTITEIKGS